MTRLATLDQRFARITCSILPLNDTPPVVVSSGLMPMANSSRARIDSIPGAVIAKTLSLERDFVTSGNYPFESAMRKLRKPQQNPQQQTILTDIADLPLLNPKGFWILIRVDPFNPRESFVVGCLSPIEAARYG